MGAKVNHVGHALESDNRMKGIFIGQVNSLLQEFYRVPLHMLINFLHTYSIGIYGSNVWGIQSAGCEKLYRSYNAAIRTLLNVDRTTHKIHD